MTSHMTLIQSEESREAKERNEGESFVRNTPRPGEWGGPDAGYLRNRETLQKRTAAYSDRLGAKARELGRGLTQPEIDAIAKEFGI